MILDPIEERAVQKHRSALINGWQPIAL